MLWMIGMFGCLLFEAGSIDLPLCLGCDTAEPEVDGLLNSSFEWSDDVPEGWSVWPNEEHLSISSEFALEGEHSLRFQTPNNGHSQNIWVSQSFPAQSGDYFRFEAHVLHTAEAPLPDGEKLRLGLWFKDHEIRLDEYRSLSINSTSETGVWQHLVVRGPAPVDTREVLAVLEFSGCNQACSQLGAVYVDQTSLEYP